MWVSGLEIVRSKLGIERVLDLSATPFFLRGSGYAEGTLFPWTVSDFSLMDAIECGIVKLPRVPVADNIPNSEMPTFRNLWHHIGKKMPKKGRGKATSLDTTSRKTRRETDADRCHVNWTIYDSEWEAEFCRVAEAHPRVRAYVKNHGLGLEVPYRFQAESRTYVPDFIVLVDDGHGEGDLLHLVVELKGFRREDAKEKADTMQTYWVPGVNGLGTYGRWDFVEFGDVYTMQADFAAKVEAEFGRLVEGVVAASLAA